MLSGALIKEMNRLGYLTPKPEVPFHGLSVRLLQGRLDSLTSPVWFSERPRGLTLHREEVYMKHPCSFSSTVMRDLREVEVIGLDLKQFKDRAEE